METTATSKGQIVIPAEVRRRFGIKRGTRIAVRIDEEAEAIVLKPISHQFIESLRGIDRGKGMLQALADERKQDREREELALKRRMKRIGRKR
jgi:AbrB family looped-hinge helix DNA binding protein